MMSLLLDPFSLHGLALAGRLVLSDPSAGPLRRPSAADYRSPVPAGMAIADTRLTGLHARAGIRDWQQVCSVVAAGGMPLVARLVYNHAAPEVFGQLAANAAEAGFAAVELCLSTAGRPLPAGTFLPLFDALARHFPVGRIGVRMGGRMLLSDQEDVPGLLGQAGPGWLHVRAAAGADLQRVLPWVRQGLAETVIMADAQGLSMLPARDLADLVSFGRGVALPGWLAQAVADQGGDDARIDA